MSGPGDRPPRYEPVEHTADRAVAIYGRAEAELYASAAWALADQLCEAERVGRGEARPVEARGADVAETTVRLMNALLYFLDAEGLVLPHLELAEATETLVRGAARGEPLDPERHGFKGALKAATYHDLLLERTRDGLRLRVVLDV